MVLSIGLLGPPGCGKTVQSVRLSHYYHLVHIAAGGLLRAEVAAGTPLGRAAAEHLARGRLVPGDLVLGIVRHRLLEADTQEGFVLDGFPRKLSEARATDLMFSDLGTRLAWVFFLRVPDETALDRTVTRLVCPDCGAVFNAKYKRPIPGEICPACRSVLHATGDGRVQCEVCGRPIGPRPDDRLEIVRDRLAEYRRETESVIDYYRAEGILEEIDATADEDEVFLRILDRLGERRPGLGAAS
ncbi:MAG: nucleoside monophosphate kinase [Dehalococcoidales bacterium]|nr:nucleoside monophosphate kinase [Dehalococcoidales bacterium]